MTAARKRGVAAPDPRQTSFVVAKADVERVLDEERGFLVEKRRQAWREGKAAAAERCEGALAAVASLRDRLLGM